MSTKHHTYVLHQGSSPLLVSVPHAGTKIPAELLKTFTEKALEVEDTDWHLEKLYAFATDLGASLIAPIYSRYAIDLNRPPDNLPMYPGSNNTELCPTRAFSGESIYRIAPPDLTEIERRKLLYWYPYHSALAQELARIKTIHGYAILWDGHSIQSHLPWLFEGRLPDLNIGTVNGTSCHRGLQNALQSTLDKTCSMIKTLDGKFDYVMNGRFKGGYITRSYGQPAQNIHAVQLEMCWSIYMEEIAPFRLSQAKQPTIAALLHSLLRTALDWRPAA